MNAQTQVSNGNQSVGLLNLEAFELSQRIAKMLSSSTLVPEQYRATIQKKAGKDEYGNQQWREEPNPNGLSNCVIALNMSNRMGADPLMVMQNLYLVNGRPSWSSQFIMAGINSSGRFSALRFDLKELGEKEVEYTETVWENRKPKKITKTVKINDISCVAWAIERETGERLESSKITIEMAVKEGWYTKEGSKWQTMSEQMLRYRAASFFGRVYAPELLMGLRSAEEEQDRIIDVTPVAESKVINASDFKNIKNLILKAKTLVDLEELESSIYALSDESERNELIKLWKASADKHKIIDAEVSAKKPESQHDEAPPVEEVKKPRSRTPKVVEAENVQKSTPNDVVDAKLSMDELKRLQAEAEALVQQQKQSSAADPIKSLGIKTGLQRNVTEAADLDALKIVAANIREYKPKLTDGHMNEVLADYAARKKFLEDQQDMFAGVEEVSYVDSVIARIQNAKSQDDINAVCADPAFDELSGADRDRIDGEAQQREAELQD